MRDLSRNPRHGFGATAPPWPASTPNPRPRKNLSRQRNRRPSGTAAGHAPCDGTEPATMSAPTHARRWGNSAWRRGSTISISARARPHRRRAECRGERQMRLRVARRIEPVGIREECGVAVRGTDQQTNVGPSVNLPPSKRGSRSARRAENRRRVVPQHFTDEPGHVVEEPLVPVLMIQHRHDAAADAPRPRS